MLGFGIHGAAATTALGHWLVFILLFRSMKKHKSRPFEEIKYLSKPDGRIMRQIVRWALPVSIESFFFSSLMMLVTRLITSFGSSPLAVYRIGGQIEQLSWLIASGFGTAMIAFIGQNYGAKREDRIDKGFRIASGAMLVWGSLTGLLMFTGGHALYSLFLSEEELRVMGAGYLRILALCQIPGCLEHIGSGYFRGTGRTTSPSVISISSNVLRVAICYILASTSLGLLGVWWGLTLTAVLRGAAIYGWGLITLLRSRKNIITREE